MYCDLRHVFLTMHKIDERVIIDRAVGLALGTAVGDAKGIPYENLTRQQIIDLQNERNKNGDDNESVYARISGLNPYIPTDWPQGRWTDDTQLTLAMMRALTKYFQSGDLMSHIVHEHIVEWNETTSGWGGTKTAIERLSLGTHTYMNSGNVAEGNGVLMKLTPLAFFYFLSGHQDDHEIERICRMTHTSNVAVATACIFIHMCMYLFQNTLESIGFLQHMLQVAIQYETKYDLKEERQLVSKRIERFLSTISSDGIDENVLITVSDGGTYYCVNSLTMLIGLIATSTNGKPDFTTIVRASEIGGDTDSNAAMLGALIGATQGEAAIDKQHIDALYRNEYVQKIGEDFGIALVQYLTHKNNTIKN